MKKFFKWFGIGFAAFLVLTALTTFLGKEQTENLTIQPVDFQQAPDGTYLGTYNGYRFTNIVEVTLKDHRIQSIDVIKTQRTALSKELSNAVIAAQSPVVDVVSGATLDRNAFLKAVENALNAAKNTK